MSWCIRSWDDARRLREYLDEKPVEKWTPSDHKLSDAINRMIQINLFVTEQTEGTHGGTRTKESIIEW